MDNQERTKYEYRTYSDVLMEINRPHQTKDQKYAIGIIKKVFEYLNSNYIYDYENFVKILKRCEYSIEWMKDLIVEFAKTIKEQKNIKIDWIIKRRIRPLKSSGINLIFNRLFFEYYDDFMGFLKTKIKKEFYYILVQLEENARKNKEKSEKQYQSILNQQITEIGMDSSSGHQDNNDNIYDNDDDIDDILLHM